MMKITQEKAEYLWDESRTGLNAQVQKMLDEAPDGVGYEFQAIPVSNGWAVFYVELHVEEIQVPQAVQVAPEVMKKLGLR